MRLPVVCVEIGSCHQQLTGRQGYFVVLVGPDGVGKTSVAEALIERHVGPAGYFHFLPPVRGVLAGAPDPVSIPPPTKSAPDGLRVLGWLRLVRNAVRGWIGYFSTVRPALRRDTLVVGDRWLYGYLVQPEPLKFRGPALLAEWVVRMLPRPHLIVNLSAPADLIRKRKTELTLQEIERELLAWGALSLPNIRTLDASRPADVIAEEIIATLRSAACTAERRGQ